MLDSGIAPTRCVKDIPSIEDEVDDDSKSNERVKLARAFELSQMHCDLSSLLQFPKCLNFSGK